VGGDELLEFCRLRRIGRARGNGKEQVAEIGAVRHREKLERVGHHVDFLAVRQMKLDRHAVRIGKRRTVRQVRYAGRIGEAHGRRNGAAVEQLCLAQRRRSGRSLEAAFNHHAFRMVGAVSGMGAEGLVHRVHDLDWERFVFSPGDSRGRQSDDGERGGKLVSQHVSLRSVRACLRTDQTGQVSKSSCRSISRFPRHVLVYRFHCARFSRHFFNGEFPVVGRPGQRRFAFRTADGGMPGAAMQTLR
jgi:hypothetical protein